MVVYRLALGLNQVAGLVAFFRNPQLRRLRHRSCGPGQPARGQDPSLQARGSGDSFDSLLLAQEAVRRPERHHLTPANVAVEGRQRQTLGQGGGHD